MPEKSPGCGSALPLLEIRASTMTAAAPESFAPGAMPMLSSSVNSFGRSFAAMRSTARGTRGPSTARAKMNTVSVSATLVASAGLMSTRPAIVAAAGGVTSARASRRGAESPATGTPLPSRWADSISAMIAVTCFASSDACGNCASNRRQYVSAPSRSRDSNAAVAASANALR